MRSYREATRRNYQANDDVIKGWIWHAHVSGPGSERTCPACWAMHGSKHKLEERLTDHICGRCAMVPDVITWEELGVSGFAGADVSIATGPTLFAKLPNTEQNRILGHAAGAAYRAGAVKLEDFVGVRESRLWGPMHYAKSLRAVLGAQEAEKWIRETRTDPVRQAMGADLNTLIHLRNARLLELQQAPAHEIDAMLQAMKSARRLPKLDYHFEQHGKDFAAVSPDDLNARFVAHVQRDDLRIATAIRGKDSARMWFLADIDSGVIAQYNETRKRYFSFYHVQDREKFDQNYALSWVEVIRQGDRWMFLPWLR